jgi:hypothetical protein
MKMPERPIFVLGFHRGGTTYLQRLINCYRDVAIFGEHNGFLTDFRSAADKVVDSHINKVTITDADSLAMLGKDEFIPWANKFGANDFINMQRFVVMNLFKIPQCGRWGFKEIRYNSEPDIRYLIKLFPASRILFLNRRPESVFMSRLSVRWSSMGTGDDKIDAELASFSEEYKVANAAARQVASATKNLLMVDYEDLLHDFDPNKAYGDFLGLDGDALRVDLFDSVRKNVVGSSFNDVCRSNVSAEFMNRVKARAAEFFMREN